MAVTATTEASTVATEGQAPIAAPASPSPTPSAPTGETPQATDPAAPAAEVTTQQTVEISEDLIRQRIAEYDPREIQKLNRKFANLVGNEADRLAEKRLETRKDVLRAQWETDWRNNQEAQELRALRDTNPELYVQREKELEERLANQQQENTRIRAQVETEASRYREESDNSLREWAQDLPEPVQQKLREMGEIDEGSWAASRRKFLQVATELHKEHLRETLLKEELPKELSKELERELAKRSKSIEEGVKLAAAAEGNAGQPTPDTGGGGSSGTGPMTQAEFDTIRADPTLRRAAMDRIKAGVAAGTIYR